MSIREQTVVFGADPEFFFRQNGDVVGSERVLPKDGIEYEKEGPHIPGGNGTVRGGGGKIIVDGVQAELNPRANVCRANMVNEIALCFQQIKRSYPDMQVDFSPLVTVTESEFELLSKRSKKFGCNSSENVYTGAQSKITVDPSVVRDRPAGGHLHFGGNESTAVKNALNDVNIIVPLFDIIVGNTCVLVDRNEGNKRRREMYGRAGEYRLKPYGIEYRTVSNFWLQHPHLMSMVMGLGRLAISIAVAGEGKNLMNLVNMSDIEKAINDNDYDLAMSNFNKIIDYVIELTGGDEQLVLTTHTITQFRKFVELGVGHWFPDNGLDYWVNAKEGHHMGFERFLTEVVLK